MSDIYLGDGKEKTEGAEMALEERFYAMDRAIARRTVGNFNTENLSTEPIEIR